MAKRIDGASESWLKGFKYDASDNASRLANDIKIASRALTGHVEDMQKNLRSFVSILEEIQVPAKEKQSLKERILGWFKSLFKAIVKVFVTLGTLISPFPLHSAAPGVIGTPPASSTLEKAATTFCGATSEPQEGKEPENLESVLLFLKEVVPREAQIAQKKLERFDEALFIMGLEDHMRAGRRVTLLGPEPAAVAKEWRDVTKRYQSVLPDDEEPPF